VQLAALEVTLRSTEQALAETEAKLLTAEARFKAAEALVQEEHAHRVGYKQKLKAAEREAEHARLQASEQNHRLNLAVGGGIARHWSGRQGTSAYPASDGDSICSHPTSNYSVPASQMSQATSQMSHFSQMGQNGLSAGQGPAGQGPAGQGAAGQGPAGQGPAMFDSRHGMGFVSGGSGCYSEAGPSDTRSETSSAHGSAHGRERVRVRTRVLPRKGASVRNGNKERAEAAWLAASLLHDHMAPPHNSKHPRSERSLAD